MMHIEVQPIFHGSLNIEKKNCSQCHLAQWVTNRMVQSLKCYVTGTSIIRINHIKRVIFANDLTFDISLNI